MSGVKTVNQQSIRGVTTASGQSIPTSASIQLLGIQKSRNIPGQVQFTRGIVAPQRNLNASTVKIATPITAGTVRLNSIQYSTSRSILTVDFNFSFHTTNPTKYDKRYTTDRYVSRLIVTPTNTNHNIE